MTFGVEVVADDLWAETVATRLQERLEPSMRLCLATGSTLSPVYRLVEDLRGATIVLLDEFGGLALDDPGRCESMIRRDLIDHLDDTPRLEMPDVDGPDPAGSADVYRGIVSTGIDLAVVGLGANGHIGMNEPGTTPTSGTRVVHLDPQTAANAATYGASSTPSWGITVGIAELMSASEVWLVVTGSHKRDILEQTLTSPIGPALPATYLREHPNCTVWADTSASDVTW